MASDDLDPRFDPHFQRGHEDDPPTGGVPLPTGGDPRFDSDPRASGDSRAAHPSRVEQLPRVEPDETPQRRNPWMVVLWVLGFALLIFGVSAEWVSRSMLLAANFNTVQEFYVIPKTLESLAPWFVAVGLASIVGVVFLHAVRWEK